MRQVGACREPDCSRAMRHACLMLKQEGHRKMGVESGSATLDPRPAAPAWGRRGRRSFAPRAALLPLPRAVRQQVPTRHACRTPPAKSCEAKVLTAGKCAARGAFASASSLCLRQHFYDNVRKSRQTTVIGQEAVTASFDRRGQVQGIA
jgi:hypothetical protein